MASLLSASRPFSFIIISVGGIILSILIASLFISYNPSGLSWSINGYTVGIGQRNQSNVSIDSPNIVEGGRFSSVAEVPAFAPRLSSSRVDDYNTVASLNQTATSEVPAFAPIFHLDEMPRFSSVAETPAFAPSLFISELQEEKNTNDSMSVNSNGSKEPDVFVSATSVDGSAKNSAEIGKDAASPPPSLVDYDKSKLNKLCDLYHGKWIYDPAGPLYTNNTCPILAQAQNCQGNGRPDKSYESWRWKPDQCNIPRFDGRKFLELMRGKTLAFIGDSLGRNQMESLLCILWQTEVPVNHGSRQMHRWHFRSTSTTIVRIWSAWLVRKTAKSAPSASPRAVNVHLDTPDDAFMQFLPQFDATILSSGHWFTAESTYLINGTAARIKRTRRSRGKSDNVKYYSMAAQTALNAIVSIPNYAGLTILRSYSPEHYEGGAWNTGGSCAKADRPAGKSARSAYVNAMRKQQAAEFEKARKRVRNGSKLKFMDVTEMSGYRHDGHAGPYRDKAQKKGPEDCLHWCMPGVADTWNEVLFEILKREL